MQLVRNFLSAALLTVAGTAHSAERLEVYIDADYSHTTSAAEAIEDGIRAALSAVDYRIGGTEIDVIPMDHRANVKRTKRTLTNYVESDTALAIFGGLHSPPYLTHREFINQSEILTLLPWSAAGPITRAAGDDANWLFRLSVDDSHSGEFFVREMVENAECKNVALILIDTGWGRGNNVSLQKALQERDMDPAIVEFFPVTVGDAATGTIAAKVAKAEADCAVLLSDWDNGARVINAVVAKSPDIQIFSHWGITGGNFTSEVSHETREKAQLRVLQTCGLRREKEKNLPLTTALSRSELGAKSLSQMPASTGFVHGYDLSTLFIQAISQASLTEGWKGDIRAKRAALKSAFETLETPVSGILRDYERPFHPYTPETPYAHEALGLNDLCLARFNEQGQLIHAE